MRAPCAAIVGICLLSALACGGVHTPDGDDTSGIQLPTVGAGDGAGAGGGPSTSTTAAQADSGPPIMEAPASGGSSAGSSSETDPSLYPPIVYCDAPAKLLTPKCGGGSCHGNQGAEMGDFAIDAQHAEKFVDKVSTRNAACGRIIDSRDYSKSFMLLKVRGDLIANLTPAQAATADESYCGGRMPVGSIVINEDQIDCLASWLQQFQR